MEDVGRVAKLIDNRLCVSTPVLSEWLGVTQQTLSNWEAQGCPKARYGYWYPPDVYKWRGDQASEEGEASVKVKKLISEQQRIAAKAAQEEIKLGEMRGEYLRKEVVTEDLKRLFVTIRRSLLGLSRQVSIELTAVDPEMAAAAETVVSDVVRRALEQLEVSGKYKGGKK